MNGKSIIIIIIIIILPTWKDNSCVVTHAVVQPIVQPNDLIILVIIISLPMSPPHACGLPQTPNLHKRNKLRCPYNNIYIKRGDCVSCSCLLCSEQASMADFDFVLAMKFGVSYFYILKISTNWKPPQSVKNNKIRETKRKVRHWKWWVVKIHENL